MVAVRKKNEGKRHGKVEVDQIRYALKPVLELHEKTRVNGTHQQVTLEFLPDADGITFKLPGAFLDAVPDGRPTR